MIIVNMAVSGQMGLRVLGGVSCEMGEVQKITQGGRFDRGRKRNRGWGTKKERLRVWKERGCGEGLT